MDEKKYTKQFFRDHKWGRLALYFELVYVLLLLYSVMFNFSLFAHLIVGQFFLILVYLIIGWLYGGYLKANGRLPVDEREKKFSLTDKLAHLFPRYSFKKSFYRALSVITSIVSLLAFIQTFAIIFADLGDKKNNFDFFDSLALYANVINLIVLGGVAIGLVMGFRRMVRNSSVTLIVMAIILAICWPGQWPLYLISVLIGLSGFWLYLHNQI